MRKLIFIGLIVFLMSFLAAASLRQRELKKETPTSTPTPLALYAAHVRAIEQYIKKRDYRGAAQYLLTHAKNRRMLMSVGSYLGRTIFDREGIGGFHYCYEISFESAFGCRYGFISEIFKTQKDPYAMLKDECFAKQDQAQMDSCLHVLGHVLVSRGAYTKDAVTRAVSDCQAYGSANVKNGMIGACASGAFMEYFLGRIGPNGLGVHGTITKDTDLKFNEANPYDICSGASQYPVCYNHIVNWWILDLKFTKDKVAQLCERIPNPEGRYSCVTMLSMYVTGDLWVPIFKEINQNPELSACKNTPEADLRQICYQNELINARRDELVAKQKAACLALHLGSDTEVCNEMIFEDMANFDYY